jgi:hypothetical protein
MKQLYEALCIKDDAKRKEPSVQKMTNVGVRWDCGWREACHNVLTENLDPRLASYTLRNAATQGKYYVNVVMCSNLYRLTTIRVFIDFIRLKIMTCEER